MKNNKLFKTVFIDKIDKKCPWYSERKIFEGNIMIMSIDNQSFYSLNRFRFDIGDCDRVIKSNGKGTWSNEIGFVFNDKVKHTEL